MHLGLIYPCLLGARMLGSTVFPWLISGPSSLRTEDCLVYSSIVLGLVLSIVAYDYQVHVLYLWKYEIYFSVLDLVLDVGRLHCSFLICRKLEFWSHYFAYSMHVLA